MIQLIVIYLYVLMAGVLVMMGWQYFRGTHDLLSFRNVALLGLCVFQLRSVAVALHYGGGHTEMTLSDPVQTGLLFCVFVTIFLVVSLWSYERGFGVEKLAARIPTARAIPSVYALGALAVALIMISALGRAGLLGYPFAQLGAILAISSGIAACGVAGWIWGPRLFNPVVIAFVGVICLAAVILLIGATYGRRPLVGGGIALLWGLYYSHFRYQNQKSSSLQLAAIAIVPLILVSLYTAARGHESREQSGLEQLQVSLERGRIGDGIALLSTGQDAGTNTLWLLEQRNTLETRWFHTIIYTLVYPVPREIWPNKPITLAEELPHLARLQRVRRDSLQLGPGIIGHVANEGSWFALFAYAILGGLLFRLADELIKLHANNPLVVIAMGCSFGYVLGMARGETSAFTALFVLGVVMMYLLLLALGKVIQTFYPPEAMIPADDEYDEDVDLHEAEEDWSHYGQPAAPSGTTRS